MSVGSREKLASYILSLGALLFLATHGCDASPSSSRDETPSEEAPAPFVSAGDFFLVRFVGEEEEEEEEERDLEDDRKLEEGDIFRVLGGGHLLNLNAYRGVQVIDVKDTSNPKIIGRLPMAGTPVEMYVDGDRALVLLNDGYGHAAADEILSGQGHKGGTVLYLDVSDHASPKVISQVAIPGAIAASRFADGSMKSSLYVAANDTQVIHAPSGEEKVEHESVLKSFDVTANALTEKTNLQLDGTVMAMQGGTGVLLVARVGDSDLESDHSTVSLVDTSDVNGALSLRGTTSVSRHVLSQFQMELRNDQLRVFSGPKAVWGDGGCYLQTFDAADKDHLAPIDTVKFVDDLDLRGVAFLEDKAFASVHGFEEHGFRTFAIDAKGKIEQKSQHITYGWNNFLQPVLGGTRLIGMGIDKVPSTSMAVGLYDITDLTNPKPVIARRDFWAGSTLQLADKLTWDHGAFQILEDAVDVKAPTGETEKGLVLLPFEVINYSAQPHVLNAGTQIFTFSSTTLTPRGQMAHPDGPRRAARMGGTSVGVNVSDTALILHDQTNLDKPTQTSRLDLAPDYVQVLPWGEHRVRIRNPEAFKDWDNPEGIARAEVIAVGADPDLAAPIATFELPAYGSYFKVGDLLVAATPRYGYGPAEMQVTVYDLAQPTSPQLKSEITSSELLGFNYGALAHLSVFVTKSSLVFTRPYYRSLEQDVVWELKTWTPHGVDCQNKGQEGCTYPVGVRRCEGPVTEQKYCAGGFMLCTDHAGAEPTCVPVDWSAIEDQLDVKLSKRASDVDPARQGAFKVLDLSDPSNPTLVPGVFSLDGRADYVGAISDGNDLHISYRLPASVPDDPRPHVHYYVSRLDLSDPGKPRLRAGVSVPGSLLDVDGDTLITRDPQWGGFWQTTAVARVKVKTGGGKAELVSYDALEGRSVYGMAVDGHKNVLVTSQSEAPIEGASLYAQRLDILTLEGSGFVTKSSARIAPGSALRSAAGGRAFFSAEEGTLVLDIDDAAKPKLQAYFPTDATPVIDGDEILDAAGRYGIFRLGKHESNLMGAPP